MWQVSIHPGAADELSRIPPPEQNAIDNALRKLEAYGPALPYPHQSAVRGTPSLRELRPRAGRSPWRALYQRVGAFFIVAAVGPEANMNRQEFARAVAIALTRLNEENRNDR